MTTTRRQKQRKDLRRDGEQIMRHAVAVERDAGGATDAVAVRRLRRAVEKAAVDLPGWLRAAFLEGVASGTKPRKPRPGPGRRRSVGALTEHALVQQMNDLIASGTGSRKAADIVASKRRQQSAVPALTANAIWLLWRRLTIP